MWLPRIPVDNPVHSAAQIILRVVPEIRVRHLSELCQTAIDPARCGRQLPSRRISDAVGRETL